MVPWLDGAAAFPDVARALREPNGLLAAGGDLEPERLLKAYRLGIFPWYSEGEPLLWWSPDPRMVLLPDEFRLPRSLAKRLRRRDYDVRADSAFAEVMAGCAQPRKGAGGAGGTWITPEMQAAYRRLHALGHAHSVETWIGDELAGGLYGVAIGRAFFGESMFARVPDASKIALAHLVFQLRRWGYGLIDCQMNTAHLARFGARDIARASFSRQLAELVNYAQPSPAPWRLDRDLIN